MICAKMLLIISSSSSTQSKRERNCKFTLLRQALPFIRILRDTILTKVSLLKRLENFKMRSRDSSNISPRENRSIYKS